jgi:hypothetical protein
MQSFRTKPEHGRGDFSRLADRSARRLLDDGHHRRDQSGDGLSIGNIDRLPGCASRAREFL